MSYTLNEIANFSQGQLIQASKTPLFIQKIVIDSRQLNFTQDALFIAIKGENHDGHRFIKEVYNKGIRNFIIDQEFDLESCPEANFILVKNTILALQSLAKSHRKRFSLPVIGITGSNGKTIVKEWLYQLLYQDSNIVRSPKSYNSQIGVPLSVWQINKDHQLAIFEAGISKGGEMKNLASIIDCEIGILTNIGSAHDEGFKNKKEKLEEKIALFKHAKKIIYRKDNPIIERALTKWPKENLFSWSTKNQADLFIKKIQKDDSRYTSITAIFKNQSLQFQLPFRDDSSIENAINCLSVLLLMEYPFNIIKKRLLQLERIAMRLELKAGIQQCTLINDSYNLDLTSLEQALNFLENQSPKGKRTLILSDVFQSGQSSHDLYKRIAELLTQKNVHQLIGVGSEISKIKIYLDQKITSFFFKDTSMFLENFDLDLFQQETILLKGARKFEFERIAQKLSFKEHQTTLEINLNALELNLNFYRNKLAKATKLMVMVKASAYGSGANEVAQLLAYQRVDYLCVAYTDEAVELRKQGIDLPIMILNPEPNTFGLIFNYDLEPEIYSFRQLKSLIFAAKGRAVKVHIKLDTGMHRLGFEQKDIPSLIPILEENKHLEVVSIFSHLVASEEQKHDLFTKSQYDLYQSMYQQIASRLKSKPIRHILNSSGILRFPQYHMDMVRLGIGLYGIDGSGDFQSELSTIHTLKARISQIKSIESEQTVGYGRRGTVNAPSRIATVSIGYADGLSRAAGNGRFSVSIKGQLAPTIGSICMDMCMVDVSAIQDVEEGDEVIIFEDHQSILKLAQALNTIPYEVFTGLSDRIKRVYYRN